MRQRSRGFTLIEVLAAMVIIALVLPVAMRGVSLAMACASHAKHQAEVSTLAEAKLNELVAEAAVTSTGTSGDFGPDHPEYRWTSETAPRDYGTNEVSVHVVWNERGQKRDLILSTLSYSAVTQ